VLVAYAILAAIPNAAPMVTTRIGLMRSASRAKNGISASSTSGWMAITAPRMASEIPSWLAM